MSLNALTTWPRKALVVCGLLSLAAMGCQANIAGQTLPSAYFLRDDVQYFPAGEEFQLPNLVRALEKYRLEQAAAKEGIATPVTPVIPVAPPAPGIPARPGFAPPAGPAGPGAAPGPAAAP